MSDEAAIDPACAVCSRRLLPGERPIRFVTSDGAEVDVCELCKPRAEAAGWLRPEEIVRAGSSPARERRRPRGAQILGGLLTRRQGAAAERGTADAQLRADRAEAPTRPVTNRPNRVGGESGEEGSATAGDREVPLIRGTSIADALVAFNRSDHRRTVAGLSRTLGPPRATAIEIKTGNGHPGVRLTIAWELTWYQWEVSRNDDGRGQDVRESGKGETIDQLRPDDRAWNLMVEVDGTVQSKAAAPAEGNG